MPKLTLEADTAADLSELLARLFPSGQPTNELKELIMSAHDNLKREVQEQVEQTKAVVAALNALRSTVADLKAQLEAAANADGLTAQEAADAAATLDAGQQEVAAALAAGNVAAPSDPAAPVEAPADPGVPTTGEDTGAASETRDGPDSAVV